MLRIANLFRNSAASAGRQLRPWLRSNGRRIYRYIPLAEGRKQWLLSFVYFIAGPLFDGSVHYGVWKRWHDAGRMVGPAVDMGMGDGPIGVQELRFDNPEDPVVSVIVVARGDLPATLRCLNSVMRQNPGIDFETILEDASGGDLTALAGVSGLHYSVSQVGLSFKELVDRAVDRAQGRYIYLLCNTAQVMDGALRAMLHVLVSDERYGLVGSKVVGVDRRLREAGCIVWRDGTTSRHGYAQEAWLPEFNYLREIDFCTEDSMMLPRAVFNQSGRFDNSYTEPAYRAADLAFSVRKSGYKVVYDPTAVVVRYNDTQLGTAAAEDEIGSASSSQKIFLKKWGEILKNENLPKGEMPVAARDRSRGKKAVLVIDQYVPQSDRDAGSRTMSLIMQELLRMGYLVKFWPVCHWYDPVYTPKLQECGIETAYSSYAGVRFDDWCITGEYKFDYVLISRPDIAREYLSAVRRTLSARVVYYGHDIHYLRLSEQLRFEGGGKALAADVNRYRELERSIWKSVDSILYPSSLETEEVKRCPGVTGNAMTLPAFAYESAVAEAGNNLRQRRDILFVANFGHPPNVNAAQLIAKEILPIVRARIPDAGLILVGSNPGAEVSQLACDFVKVTGFVPEEILADYYRHSRVAVAPLQYGGGLKGKVVEAMRFGLPIVTTPIGAQGLDEAATALGVHSSAVEIAADLVVLLEDDKEWLRRSSAGVAYVNAKYSFSTFRGTLQQCFT